jgi:hypothetical protein
MRRTRLIVLILVALAAGGFWVGSRLAEPPVVPGYVPFSTPDPHRLQADEEGYYIPDDQFTVRAFQFNGFSLRPDPLVIFSKVKDSVEHPSLRCQNVRASGDSLHLVCEYPQLGTVMIDGTFPIREAEDRAPGPRFVGLVTVNRDGRTLYRKQHSFVFTMGE